MEHTGSWLTLLGFAVMAGYLGYRVKREREKLREVVSVLGEQDGPLIDSLESLVRRGQLVPAATN